MCDFTRIRRKTEKLWLSIIPARRRSEQPGLGPPQKGVKCNFSSPELDKPYIVFCLPFDKAPPSVHFPKALKRLQNNAVPAGRGLLMRKGIGLLIRKGVGLLIIKGRVIDYERNRVIDYQRNKVIDYERNKVIDYENNRVIRI